MVCASCSDLHSDIWQQRSLPLKYVPAYTDEAWVAAPCNALAERLVRTWQLWPTPRFACVCGPKSCGKTHLAHIFCALAGGVFLRPDTPAHEQLLPGVGCAYAIDGLENFSERWLFSAYNVLLERNAYVLATARHAPAVRPFQIADVASRWRSVPTFEMPLPDDETLYAVWQKLLGDHGIRLAEDDLWYCLRRLPRSFESVRYWTSVLAQDGGNGRHFSRARLRALLGEQLGVSEG